jgi:uncharacterized membrane protein
MNSELMFGIFLILVSSLINATAISLIKKSSKTFSLNGLFNLSIITKNKFFVIAAILYFLSMVVFVFSLKFGPLSVLSPIASLTYIWTSLFAVKFFNERMNLFKWLGVLMIVLGSFLIGFS